MDNPEKKTAAAITLTPAVIQRVYEGVAAARDPHVQTCTQMALADIAAIAEGRSDARISGHLRRWFLRRFIRALFHIQIECPENIPHEPVVLVANHLSHLDPFLILASVPHRPYYYILGMLAPFTTSGGNGGLSVMRAV